MPAPEPLYNATLPLAPTGTTTRFGTVCPATKFRFDAAGRVAPSAKAVTNPDPAGAATVTFSTTAATPEAGTPPWPSTGRCSVAFAATRPTAAPIPLRVSSTRAGPTDTKVPARAGATAVTAGTLGDAMAMGPASARRPPATTAETERTRRVRTIEHP